jgi:hypothetical protein
MFNLGRAAILFLHPTLRNLTLSCFDIGDDLGHIISQASNKTPLTSLVFDECNITHLGLAAVLSVPKALERLTLGERMHHAWRTRNVLQNDPGLLLQILQSQGHSLKYLKHIGGHRWHSRTTGHGASQLSLAFLSNVQMMELSSKSILVKIAAGCGALPSSLQTLRLLEPRDSVNFLLRGLEAAALWVHTVPNLDIVLGFNIDNEYSDDLMEGVWSKEDRLDTVQKLSPYLARNGVKRLKIFLPFGSGYIPPYRTSIQHPARTSTN